MASSIDAPNRPLYALALLFIVMAISVALAVMVPYVDVNAQEAAALLAMDEGGGVVDAAILSDGYDGLSDSHSGSTKGDSISSSISNNHDNSVEKEIIDDSGGADQSALEVHVMKSINGSTEGDSSVVANSTSDSPSEVSNHKPIPTHHTTEHSIPAGNEHPLRGGVEAATDHRQEEPPRPPCQALLVQVDRDANDLLTPAEYVALVAHILRGDASHIAVTDRYAELPYRLKINFVHLACVCSDCCADEDAIYLAPRTGATAETICEHTEEAIGKALEEGWTGA